jgi:hypothetical protein
MQPIAGGIQGRKQKELAIVASERYILSEPRAGSVSSRSSLRLMSWLRELFEKNSCILERYLLS